MSGWDDWSCLRALAAAHAAVGESAEAARWAAQALAHAPASARAAVQSDLDRYTRFVG